MARLGRQADLGKDYTFAVSQESLFHMSNVEDRKRMCDRRVNLQI